METRRFILQGCQIFLGATYQNGTSNDRKIYQIAINNTEYTNIYHS
jgi:hypothetical protein